MSGFKLKLVAYFVLLSLLPVAAAFWGFATVSGEKETRQVDARLQDGLLAAEAGFQVRLDRAQANAERLARTRSFQLALVRRDRRKLAESLRRTPDVFVLGAGGFEVGRRPSLAASRRVDVVAPHGLAGSVVGSVPLDTALLIALRRSAGLTPTDVLAVLVQGRVVAASAPLSGAVRLPADGGPATVTVGVVRYRALATPALAGAPAAAFAVLGPQSLIDAAVGWDRTRLLVGLLVCVGVIAAVAYLEGRSIVGTLRTLADAAHGIARGRLSERVPVRGRDEFAQLGVAFNDMAVQLEARLEELEAERGRLRDAIDRFGTTLAATHDVDQLLHVITEGAVEATGAAGGRLTLVSGGFVESGDPEAGEEQLELPLASGNESFGVLVLAGGSFDEEQRMNAAALVSQAAIALENVRLHRLIEQQALVDALTGVANRRASEEALNAEVARAGRLGTPLAVGLADLDDFKAINDLHGHAVGDVVLRTFAAVLRETIRESDLAGRWGGEEFVLLLPGASADGAVRLCDRIRLELVARSEAGRLPVAVRCSFGVAQHEPGGTADELFAAADRALYRAKRLGKNRVELERPGAFHTSE